MRRTDGGGLLHPLVEGCFTLFHCAIHGHFIPHIHHAEAKKAEAKDWGVEKPGDSDSMGFAELMGFGV